MFLNQLFPKRAPIPVVIFTRKTRVNYTFFLNSCGLINRSCGFFLQALSYRAVTNFFWVNFVYSDRTAHVCVQFKTLTLPFNTQTAYYRYLDNRSDRAGKLVTGKFLFRYFIDPVIKSITNDLKKKKKLLSVSKNVGLPVELASQILFW